ncbi:hypothetical protein ACG2LH_08475 [Zhouia sp. PK063]|uniref:hypothetical protein n=1 Tax=Zhouia sp. PK063 TaxID=3373602 RepID=UPI0037AF8B6B
MRKTLTIIALIIVISCTDKKLTAEKHDSELEENWTCFTTKDSIPKLLILALKETFENNFEMANFNEKFNETDVIINDSIPDKKLQLLSRKNNLWRISYVQGGFAKHYVFAECKIINDSIFDFKISQTALRLDSNDSINKYITEKKIVLKKIKILIK